MQTINKTQYHCAELRRSVPLIQRVEWVSGIGQDDAEPVVLAEAWGRLRKRKKSYAKVYLRDRRGLNLPWACFAFERQR